MKREQNCAMQGNMKVNVVSKKKTTKSGPEFMSVNQIYGSGAKKNQSTLNNLIQQVEG